MFQIIDADPKKGTKCPSTANICGAIPPEVVAAWHVVFMKKGAGSINVIRSWPLRLSDLYFGKCRM